MWHTGKIYTICAKGLEILTKIDGYSKVSLSDGISSKELKRFLESLPLWSFKLKMHFNASET